MFFQKRKENNRLCLDREAHHIRIKPCPFCGGKARVQLKSWENGESVATYYEATCDEWRGSMSRVYAPDAISAWNRRESNGKSAGII